MAGPACAAGSTAVSPRKCCAPPISPCSLCARHYSKTRQNYCCGQPLHYCCSRSHYCCGRSPDRATCLHESGGHGQETGPSHMKTETGPSHMKTETSPSHMKTETSPSHTKTSLTEHQVHVREKMLTRSNTGIREPDLTTINRDQLERLANYSGDLCLSIYMPVAGPQRELQQGNAILLRNLIREADTQLREPPYELRARERRALLRLARRISRWNGNFWAYQQEGLAFFLAPDFQQIVTLPVAPPAQVVLAPHFYVKPLLACPLGDHHFYVLALSLKQSRLYHATCAGIEEIPLPDVPTSLQEAVPSDRFEKQL